MESSSNLNGNCGVQDESSSTPVTVESVSELLYQEYAILTGSKTIDDHYILLFPDRGNFHQLGEADYRRLMKYLTSVPPMQDAESGFVLIVDRRNDKWNSVKTLLIRVSCYFPALIHRVFVLRPAGFLQKALSEVSTKLFRTENLRFRLTVCNNVSDLLSFVDAGQLTLELGGWLVYNKVQWVQQRVEVEAYHVGLQTLSRDLKSFTESFVDLEYPNDVVSTEKLIQSKTEEYNLLKSDLTQAADHGESILRRIKSNGVVNGTNGNSTENSRSVSTNSSVLLVNVILVERFILQIDETGKLFEEFWVKEKQGLARCLHLRRFEQDFRELRASFDVNVKSLSGIPEMGETLAMTESLILDTFNFQEVTKADLKRALELEVIGKEIVAMNPSSIDIVEPKCIELQRMASHFRFIVQEKVSKQKQWREVQSTIEKANKLCTEEMDLISSQKMIESTEESPDWNKMKSDVDSLLIKMESQIEELVLLKGSLANTCQSKTLIKQVLRRVEEAQIMCLKRQASLLQLIEKKSASFFKTRRSSGNAFQSMDSKSLKSLGGDGETSSVDGSSCSSMTKSSLSSTNSSDGGVTNGKSGEEEREKQVKRSHVLQELLQTEQTYVEEIGLVLTGYRDQAVKPELKSLLPSQLMHDYDSTKVGANVAVLFCNLDEIYSFHSKIFLPDLSTCIQSIELVALCFIQRHSDFLAMYSQYCQLKAASDSLLKEIGESNPWLTACREKLGHRLPLSSYLLKPVQRITKYHLILGSLLKYSNTCDGYSELIEALDCMVVVVRSVNDGMHQLHIRGYPAKLSAEGPLLLQGPFTVWIETAKARLRLKGHQRYLFLYQKSILVCKKTGQQSSLTYEFKNKINLSEVGITEDPKGSGASKKFEIWVQGRQKVFVLQASSRETKVQWVKEIKSLLMEQLQFLRETKNAPSSTTQQSVVSGKPSASASAVANTGLKRNKMMIYKGATLNGWRTSSAGHRPLRQAASYETSDSNSSGRPKSGSMDTDFEEEHCWSTECSNSEDDESVSQILPLSGRSEATGPGTVANPKVLNKSGSSSSMSMYGVGENIENGPKFVVSTEYIPIDPSCEIPLKEGEVVILVKTGCAGWWFVRTTGPEPIEGWAPSGFLERQSHPSLSSISSSMSSQSVATLEAPAPLYKQSSVPCLPGMSYNSSNYAVDQVTSDFHYEASAIRKMCSELSSESSEARLLRRPEEADLR